MLSESNYLALCDYCFNLTFFRPLSTWQACMQPYADKCSDNVIYKMLAPIQDQLKSVCNGT